MYWLLYDIPSNRRRNKVVQLCKDYGLQRIQKSCFYGNIKAALMNQFQRQLDQLLLPEDQVCLIPVPDKAIRETRMWGGQCLTPVSEDTVCFL